MKSPPTKRMLCKLAHAPPSLLQGEGRGGEGRAVEGKGKGGGLQTFRQHTPVSCILNHTVHIHTPAHTHGPGPLPHHRRECASSSDNRPESQTDLEQCEAVQMLNT